ncbi:hypothetical protein [Cytobacillus oceanisediminis]|uniref:hypothetical protein n=1 Tax=Cytobacillus oceanisediminis TaxID=665099 RepID=UPI001C212C2D|nr:hypothetical protein [Cytobacillus oceanisediminis]
MGKRQINMIPTWLLGTGAQFGTLTPYTRNISFTLLVTVFFQELNDDERRTREDMINTVINICRAQNIPFKPMDAEKVVDSLLWSEGKNYGFSFEDYYYEEKTKSYEKYRFQYFVLDKDISDLENARQVYKLSEQAQEVVLKSHEILEEMDISIQQIVATMLIKKGSLTRALRMMDALDFRVRNLINEEKAHKEDLVRNPKRAIFEKTSRWGTQIAKVKEQFEEERSKYSQMDRVLKSLEILEDQRTVYLQLTKRIAKTSLYHDELARLVIENIRLELQILNNQFSTMWMVNGTSFRKTVWEETILPYGLASPDDMLELVESVLSPKRPFLMPLEWGIEEQTVLTRETKFVQDDGNITGAEVKPIELDWETIVLLFEPVFLELLEKKEVAIDVWLKGLDEFTLSRWIEHREAFDFWVAFGSLEEPLVITEELLDETIDTRIELLSRLIEKNEKFKELIGKVIEPKVIKRHIDMKFKKVEVSKFAIILKEV